MKEIKLNIKGMHCASCAANIERTLSNQQGIKEVNVNLLAEKARVVFDETKQSSDNT